MNLVAQIADLSEEKNVRVTSAHADLAEWLWLTALRSGSVCPKLPAMCSCDIDLGIIDFKSVQIPVIYQIVQTYIEFSGHVFSLLYISKVRHSTIEILRVHVESCWSVWCVFFFCLTQYYASQVVLVMLVMLSSSQLPGCSSSSSWCKSFESSSTFTAKDSPENAKIKAPKRNSNKAKCSEFFFQSYLKVQKNLMICQSMASVPAWGS